MLENRRKIFNVERFIQEIWKKNRMIHHFPIDYSPELTCVGQEDCWMYPNERCLLSKIIEMELDTPFPQKGHAKHLFDEEMSQYANVLVLERKSNQPISFIA